MLAGDQPIRGLGTSRSWPARLRVRTTEAYPEPAFCRSGVVSAARSWPAASTAALGGTRAARASWIVRHIITTMGELTGRGRCVGGHVLPAALGPDRNNLLACGGN